SIANSQSVAQVIQALTAVGIDPQGKDFTKTEGQNPVSNLLSYQLKNGSFHNQEDTKQTNNLATEQALAALASLQQFYKNGKSTIYSKIDYAGVTAPPLFATDKPFAIES